MLPGPHKRAATLISGARRYFGLVIVDGDPRSTDWCGHLVVLEGDACQVPLGLASLEMEDGGTATVYVRTIHFGADTIPFEGLGPMRECRP